MHKSELQWNLNTLLGLVQLVATIIAVVWVIARIDARTEMLEERLGNNRELFSTEISALRREIDRIQEQLRTGRRADADAEDDQNLVP